MLKSFFEYYANIDTKIKRIMKFGFVISLIILLTSTFLFCTYEFICNSPKIYYIGLLVFKLGSIYLTSFFCFGFSFNKILHEI